MVYGIHFICFLYNMHTSTFSLYTSSFSVSKPVRRGNSTWPPNVACRNVSFSNVDTGNYALVTMMWMHVYVLHVWLI